MLKIKVTLFLSCLRRDQYKYTSNHFPCLLAARRVQLSRHRTFLFPNRWCIVHISFCRFMRDMMNVVNSGPVPPAIMRLSDGGHIENLALLPLFKRRLQKIVFVNGGYTVPESKFADDLLLAMDLARRKLNCSFSGMDGRDVFEDVKEKFVMMKPGEQPRSYKFKVQYYDKQDKYEPGRKVGEGVVILIAPRPPDKGANPGERQSWKEALHDMDVDLEAGLWGRGPHLDAEEVERLTFCCCTCCHGDTLRGCSESMCGVFPQHITANQFFTPDMFSAYHREGYRACTEAGAAEFLKSDADA